MLSPKQLPKPKKHEMYQGTEIQLKHIETPGSAPPKLELTLHCGALAAPLCLQLQKKTTIYLVLLLQQRTDLCLEVTSQGCNNSPGPPPSCISKWDLKDA